MHGLNRFRVEVRPNPWEGWDLHWAVQIDDAELVPYDDYVVDMRELFESLSADGDRWIITCTCGAPNCAGVEGPVSVTRVDRVVRWNVPGRRRSDARTPLAGAFSFDADAYDSAIRAALAETRRRVAVLPLPAEGASTGEGVVPITARWWLESLPA